MIKVLFFAKLSELLETRELLVEPSLAADTEQLFSYLKGYQPEWDSILSSQPWLKAVNQSMTTATVAINAGDEVAFFPPVTGG